MDQTQDFKSLQDQVQASLIATTRTAGQLSSEDLSFQRSLNPEVGPALDEQNTRLLALTSSLLKSAISIADLNAPNLEDAEDIENNWRSVVDVVDSLLEKADMCLDEYTGVIKRKEKPDQATPSKTKKNPSSLGNSFRTQNLVKPQLAFDVKPDNFDNTPWRPLINTKPHAVIALEDSLDFITNDHQQKQHRHPYETEILQLQYPKVVYKIADPIPYLPVDTTSAVFVDTYEGVLEMLAELKNATEIAVDLEHHDARSYVGLVSLMQISTRNKDWIVDTLKPWRQELQVLNEVFTDPKIIKVFHGAYMDIVWLQRDLGLYVVGLFDTHWASRTLGYQAGSLAFLLKKFIDFDADKKYQMADWRIRPIPDEMFFYARADTHYLLYIFDNIRNELVSKSDASIPEENRIELVLQKSKETSLLRFERQVYNTETGKGPGGWYQLLAKSPNMFNNEQFAVFRAIHRWRDGIARKDDDSTAFVMPNHVLFTLAKLMPMDMIALLGAAHPISYSVKSRAGELLEVIKKAREEGKTGPSMSDLMRHEKPGAVETSVSTPRNISPKSEVTPVDQGQLRSESSSFWGGAFGSSLWDGPTGAKVSDGMRLAIPLPQLAPDAFDVSTQALTDRSRITAETESAATPPLQPNQPSNEPFIIKRGAKRKSEADSEPEDATDEPSATAGEYDILLDDRDAQEARSRAAQKAERRAAKKLEKAERKKAKLQHSESNESAEGEANTDEPFDYSKAASVLHGKSSGEQGSKRKKPFDPYQKSTDAPKGMRRLQTERPGKSFTFKK
ncbi:Exosome complex exonuclease rrp6 [Phlyctema vagabunda]|uniref:Exosome complex exonuclease rrp6 n=1 Tax=Phlyctema vagabunda TaxID=108571 RepID=A0ABR4PSB2_9HELO